jgi:hypothetical protein
MKRFAFALFKSIGGTQLVIDELSLIYHFHLWKIRNMYRTGWCFLSGKNR